MTFDHWPQTPELFFMLVFFLLLKHEHSFCVYTLELTNTSNVELVTVTLSPTETSLWSLTWSQCVRNAMRNFLWSWRRDWRSCLKLLHGSKHTVKRGGKERWMWVSMHERKEITFPELITIYHSISVFYIVGILHLSWLFQWNCPPYGWEAHFLNLKLKDESFGLSTGLSVTCSVLFTWNAALYIFICLLKSLLYIYTVYVYINTCLWPYIYTTNEERQRKEIKLLYQWQVIHFCQLVPNTISDSMLLIILYNKVKAKEKLKKYSCTESVYISNMSCYTPTCIIICIIIVYFH